MKLDVYMAAVAAAEFSLRDKSYANCSYERVLYYAYYIFVS